jgi:hypothetical protein
MTNYVRTLYEVNPVTPLPRAELGRTGTVIWSEVTGYQEILVPRPHFEPIYGGKTYVDSIDDSITTPFLRASIILSLLSQSVLALEVITALVLEPPAYAVVYDGTTFSVSVPPPVDFIESHNWAGWPVHPIA